MHISQLKCDFLDFLFMITMSGIRCIFRCKLSLSLVFSWLFQFSITAKCDCITTFKLPIQWIQVWSLFSPTLAIFTLCYLTNRKSTSWRDFLPERINPQSTAGDENTSVMSCHSDVLVSIFLSSGIMQTKYLWFHLYWSQAYFDGDTCVIKGNSSYCKVL